MGRAFGCSGAPFSLGVVACNRGSDHFLCGTGISASAYWASVFGLSLHPDKTRFVDFRSNRPDGANHPETNGTSFTFLGALQKADIEKWLPIIKAAGIKPE